MRASGALRAAGAPVLGGRPPESRPAGAVLVRFSWLDQMASAIDGGALELIQAGPGTGGWLASISLHDVEVQLGGYGVKALTRGAAAATRVSVLVPLRVRSTGLWEGCPSDPGAVLVYAPGAQQFSCDAKGALWARVSVGAEQLEHAFFAATGRELGLPQASFRRLRPSPVSLERLKRRLRGLPASSGAAAAPRKTSRRCQEKQLLIELCRVLGSDANTPSRPTRGVDPRQIVWAVEEHVERVIPERTYLADLAAAAEASERTVEYAFRRLLGLTPMHYVKLRRLSCVHRELRDSAPGSRTVTRVALDGGFEHLSQFARDYRSVYGETPSATLRRARVPPFEPACEKVIAGNAATGHRPAGR